LGLLNNCRSILDKITIMSLKLGEKRKVKDSRRKNLIDTVVLTKEQKNKIDEFFKANYGKKIPYHWHRLYQSFTGTYNEKYFPEILFSTEFEKRANDSRYRYVLDDKLLLPVFVNGIENVKIPETIATFCNGIYFDNKNDVKTKNEFIELVKSYEKAVIKPTQDTTSGKGVNLLLFGKTKNGESLEEIIESYKGGAFIVQEAVLPHNELKALYPNAINTFRIVTYIWKGQVYHWPVTLRIGQGGNFVDNAHAGGMFIAVSDEGVLNDKAFTEFQTVYTEHPDTKVKFEGYKLSFVPSLIEAAKKMHLNVSQLGVISWDLTVNESGKIVLVEANTAGQTVWFPQMASGRAAFGENTADVLKWIGKNKI